MRTGKTRSLLTIVAVLSMLTAAFVTTAMAEHSPPDGIAGQCDGHQDNAKDEPGGSDTVTVDGTEVDLTYSEDLKKVTFSETVVACVKAGNANSGEHTGDSIMVDWTNNGGQTPDISNVVVYGFPEGCPDGEVEDSVTGECTTPCPDGSAPANGECPPEPCPEGQVADTVTGDCVTPCPDGSPPANGECPVEGGAFAEVVEYNGDNPVADAVEMVEDTVSDGSDTDDPDDNGLLSAIVGGMDLVLPPPGVGGCDPSGTFCGALIALLWETDNGNDTASAGLIHLAGGAAGAFMNIHVATSYCGDANLLRVEGFHPDFGAFAFDARDDLAALFDALEMLGIFVDQDGKVVHVDPGVIDTNLAVLGTVDLFHSRC